MGELPDHSSLSEMQIIIIIIIIHLYLNLGLLCIEYLYYSRRGYEAGLKQFLWLVGLDKSSPEPKRLLTSEFPGET